MRTIKPLTLDDAKLIAAAAEAETMPVVPLEGGEPILCDAMVIGAVGVSGVKAGEDAQVARAGVAALEVIISAGKGPSGNAAADVFRRSFRPCAANDSERHIADAQRPVVQPNAGRLRWVHSVGTACRKQVIRQAPSDARDLNEMSGWLWLLPGFDFGRSGDHSRRSALVMDGQAEAGRLAIRGRVSQTIRL